MSGAETTANGQPARTSAFPLKLLAIILIVYGVLRLVLLAILIQFIGDAVEWRYWRIRPDIPTFVRGLVTAIALALVPIVVGVAMARGKRWTGSFGPLVCLFVFLFELYFIQFDRFGWYDPTVLYGYYIPGTLYTQLVISFVLLSLAAILMRSAARAERQRTRAGRFPQGAEILLVAVAAGLLVPVWIGPIARIVISFLLVAIAVILVRRMLSAEKAERPPRTRPGRFSRSSGVLLVAITAGVLIPLWAGPVATMWSIFTYLPSGLGPSVGLKLWYLLLLLVRVGVDVAALAVGLGLARRRPAAYLPALFIVGLAAWIHSGALSQTGLSYPVGVLEASYAIALMAILGLLLASPPRLLALRRFEGEADGEIMRPVTTTIPDDEGWRPALLASLRESGVTSPKENPGRPVALTALLISVGAIAQFFGNVFLPQMIADAAVVTRNLVTVLWTCGWIFIISPVFRLGRRMMTAIRAKSAVDELSKPEARRPILYLRSFDIDQDAGRPAVVGLMSDVIQAASPEQTLARVLSRAGPVVAIGRPGEKLPQLGAARFYVTDDLWKQKVADIAKAAQLVVWTSGVSDGLRWEIAYLLKAVPLRKLVLWAHPHLVEDTSVRREEEWKLFCSSIGQAFPKPLPQSLGDTEFFIFGDDGSPIAIEPKLSRFRSLVRRFVGAREPSLRAILAAKGMV